jgi:serine/threonine protein kinase
MEMVNGGDLYDYLDKRDFDIPEKRGKELSLAVAKGLKYLHDFGVVHRDIKLENILMTDNTEQGFPKLSDCGLSTIIGPGRDIKEACGTIVCAVLFIFRLMLLQKFLRARVLTKA